jgi:hypothetical protein
LISNNEEGIMTQIEYKVTTIRIPIDLWKRLRRAQEDGLVASIQQAAIDGMELVLKEGQEVN